MATVKLALIGHVGHWRTYAQMLKELPNVTVKAVTTASAEESLGTFADGRGISSQTRRYSDPLEMLERELLDIVQVCTRPDLMPGLTMACIERGIAVMSEKPLAMDLPTLAKLYEAAVEREVLVLPMHAMRSDRALATVREVVRSGRIGHPLVSFHQKSYKWGDRRPDYYRSRKTFPGIAPWVGIHAFDWMVWILGDMFTSVYGLEATTAHPDYLGCASQASYVFGMVNGGVAVVTLDYLRPQAASSHGDERVRIAGTEGVVESIVVEDRVTLITSDQVAQDLALVDVPYWYTTFAQAVMGEGQPFMEMGEAFRITEISLKAQQSAETAKSVSLEGSRYRSPLMIASGGSCD